MKHKRSVMSITLTAIVLVSLCAMCPSTSVIAASSSGTPTSSTHTTTSVDSAAAPGGIVGDPAVCSQPGTNSLDLFVRGTDNALWWRHQASSGSWSNWKSLGGTLTSSPGAASPGADALFVAVRGTTSSLYVKFTVDGGNTWSTWFNIGGQILAGTGPALSASASSSVKYFVTGTNHKLYWSTGSSWTSLGGYLTSSPGATTWLVDGRNWVEVAARGSTGAFYLRASGDDGGTWDDWSSYYGGQILAGTGPALAFYGKTDWSYAYFVTGTNHQLYYTGGSWWYSIGGYLTSSPAAASPARNATNVFVVGTNGALYTTSTVDGMAHWSPWSKVL